MNTRHRSGFLAGFWALRLIPLIFLFLGFSASLFYVMANRPSSSLSSGVIQVLSYSSFLGSWGPGPEIAKRFNEQTGFIVQYLDAGDAGLLLKKLELFNADVVVGVDRLSLPSERIVEKNWRDLSYVSAIKQTRFDQDLTPLVLSRFIAYDWSPMSFVYRQGESRPPESFDDLLSTQFKSAIALEDPRTSTPGLQFFFWVLDELGVETGFEFLEKLKPSIHSVSSSWSQAYGAFSKGQAKFAFSYLTSPVFHWTVEKNGSYQAARFASGLPVQVEYVAVPAGCRECAVAEKFIAFLLLPEIQRLIMEKNLMLPVDLSVTKGTPFETLNIDQIKTRSWRNLPALIERKSELFDRWRMIGL